MKKSLMALCLMVTTTIAFASSVQKVTLCQHGANGTSQNIEVPIVASQKLIENGAYPGTCEEEELYGNRTYVSYSYEECGYIRWSCYEGQQSFVDETGCGCEPIAQ